MDWFILCIAVLVKKWFIRIPFVLLHFTIFLLSCVPFIRFKLIAFLYEKYNNNLLFESSICLRAEAVFCFNENLICKIKKIFWKKEHNFVNFFFGITGKTPLLTQKDFFTFFKSRLDCTRSGYTTSISVFSNIYTSILGIFY